MLYDKLFDYQKNIVNSYKDRSSLGLFLDMGLGKTIVSLAFAEKNDCENILVITINAKAIEGEDVKGSWLNWISFSDTDFVKISKGKSYCNNGEKNVFFLRNYESLYKKHNTTTKHKIKLSDDILQFIDNCFDKKVAVIIDESQYVKNTSSLRTLAVNEILYRLKIVSKKVFTYLLSGEPFTQGYIDLFSQLKMLGYNKTKTYFIDRYCVRGNVFGLLGWQQPIVGYKNIDELIDLIHKYAVTIKSKEVIDLPEQIFTYIPINKSTYFDLLTQEKLPLSMINDELKKRDLPLVKYNNNPFYRNLDYNNTRWLCDTISSFWIRTRQISIGFQGNSEESHWYDTSRLTALKKLLSEYPDNYVIFYNFTPELTSLYEICEDLNYNIDVYCGEIKSLIFYNNYENHLRAKEIPNKNNVILANYTSGSTGMNWQNYNKCILFSIPLFKDYEQCLKRVHRIGQKETTFYYIFYQENWLDESMLKSLKEKQDYSQKMFEYNLKLLKD